MKNFSSIEAVIRVSQILALANPTAIEEKICLYRDSLILIQAQRVPRLQMPLGAVAVCLVLDGDLMREVLNVDSDGNLLMFDAVAEGGASAWINYLDSLCKQTMEVLHKRAAEKWRSDGFSDLILEIQELADKIRGFDPKDFSWTVEASKISNLKAAVSETPSP